MRNKFIELTKKHTDIIISINRENKVTIDVLVSMIKKKKFINLLNKT